MIRRLGANDYAEARRLFVLMAEVFENDQQPLSEDYLRSILSRPEFWALAAYREGELVGGLTAHALPMTTSEEPAVFLYDIAVHAEFQRRGVGRALVTALREQAPGPVFVLADNEDEHALDFYRALGGQALPSTMFDFARPG